MQNIGNATYILEWILNKIYIQNARKILKQRQLGLLDSSGTKYGSARKLLEII